MTMIQLMAGISIAGSMAIIYISAKYRSSAGTVFGLLLLIANVFSFLHA